MSDEKRVIMQDCEDSMYGIATELDARGNLVLIASEDFRADLAEAGTHYKRESMVSDALHERYEFIRPEDIGALTDAPILVNCEDTTIEDNGDRAFFAPERIYWFPSYMIEDEWETLATQGRVTFDAARE